MKGAFLCVWDMASAYLWLTDCSVCQILKDITTRYKLLRGYRVHFVWDMPSGNAHLWLFCLSDPEGCYNLLQISAWMQSIQCVGYAQCLPLIVLSVSSWGTLQPTTNFCVECRVHFLCGIWPVLTSDWLLVVLSVRSWRTLQPTTNFCVGTECILCGTCPVLTSDCSVRSWRTLQPATNFYVDAECTMCLGGTAMGCQ